MGQITFQQILDIVGGEPRMDDREGAPSQRRVERFVADHRQTRDGDVFWDIESSTADAARRAAEAYRRGAQGVVSEANDFAPPAGCWALAVEDADVALRTLVRWRRQSLNGEIIAVAGVVGKTTTCAMIKHVLGAIGPRQVNTYEVGGPVDLLNLREDDDYALVECSDNAHEEFKELIELVAPRFGVITQLGEPGVDGLAIVRTYAALLGAVRADGCSVLNGRHRELRRFAPDCRAKQICFGRTVDCDVLASEVRHERGRLGFRVDRQLYELPVWGRHHLDAALAAIAMGRLLGVSDEKIADRLRTFAPAPTAAVAVGWREATVIHDAENTSPTAMRAALELLREYETRGRRIVMCDDLRDVGARAAHTRDDFGGDVVTRCGADRLIACGERAEEITAGARRAGMPADHAVACRNVNDAVTALEAILAAGDVVLVKASRKDAIRRLTAAAPQPLRRAA